jgi:NAD+ diphosphatase
MALDRAVTLRRDADWILDRMRDKAARVVYAGSDGVLIDAGRDPKLVRICVDAPEKSDSGIDEPLLLGLEGDVPIFAVDLEALAQTPRASVLDQGHVVGMREAGAILSRSEGGLAAYLMAMLNWHRSHRFCSNCGSITTSIEAGYSRRCAACGGVHFPRTDPVVIMTVEHAQCLLLGREARWPPRQYSILAGFVLPGESLEEAVGREVREESGIEVHDVRFVSSQPWPFPSSLMLGFAAQSGGGEPAPRDGELEDVAWFDLDVVRAALAGPDPDLSLPPSISIAHFLIQRWAATRVTMSRTEDPT